MLGAIYKPRKIFLTLLASVFCLLSSGFFLPPSVFAACDQNCNKDSGDDAYLSCIKDKQSCLEGKIAETKQEQITLSNTISILENQIFLQELEIEETETEIRQLERQIEDLNSRLSGLEISLDELSALLVERIQEQYKQRRSGVFDLLFISDSLNGFLRNIQYVKKSQNHVHELLSQAELQRVDYSQQKELKEEKQAEVEQKQLELESQKVALGGQKRDQEILLTETKHNESRYQDELAKTLAELEAIQSIIAGKGDENSVGEVKEGDKIASIIPGASVCSTGTHLHFEVAKDGAHRNPAEYLKSTDIIWSNHDGPFSFSGGWNWPVNNAARITQGYGMTWYAAVQRAYGGAPHTGIDMVSKSYGDYTIKAVKDGKLYRGSIPCGAGLLRYVKVEHDEGGISTYYLHVNY